MMIMRRRYASVLSFSLAAILGVFTLGTGLAAAQHTVKEIIDATGDGADKILDGSEGIAVDGSGNVYVAGFHSNNVFKITPAGVITEIIDCTGDGTGVCGPFSGNFLNRPRSIALDGAGNVYVVGEGSDNAFKITAAGVITEIIDATGDGAGNILDRPFAIASDVAGNVYVTGLTSDNAFKITPAGVITEIIDATGDGAGNTLNAAFGIAVDAAGNAYVTADLSNNAFKITPVGVITEIIDCTGDGTGNCSGKGTTNELEGSRGVAVDGSGNAYVIGEFSDNVFKITPAGVVTEIIDLGSNLNNPAGIAVDVVGNAYVSGGSSQNAFKVTPAGVITQIMDSTGDGAGNGLSNPAGVAVDAAGNVYVSGWGSDNAFKITPASGTPPADAIPAVSDFGMVVLLLLTAVAGVIVVRGRLRRPSQ